MLNISSTFLIRCSQTGTVWLFNCPESCQQILNKSKININQIDHIIITDLKTETTSGLIGLLSSLSLNDRIQSIKIYGPPGLMAYITLARKYSKTTFKYHLDIYINRYTYIHQSNDFYLYFHPFNQFHTSLKYTFIEREQQGRLQASKARKYGIAAGPIYRYLKMHKKYILPDGTIITGTYFTNTYSKGAKVLCSLNRYGFRINYEIMTFTNHGILKV
uniref:Ribonuclease Z n=1 Tax=Liagora harveyana TaxID=406718 RepID=A0A1G4NV50_9FLOR|nr:Ribonuclease Z [Liagora harveyana]SCW22484.1 Ribonuclease Z [Liagora harveyana]